MDLRPLVVLGVVLSGVAVGAPAQAATSFRNCTAMRQVYPHGVARPGAKDKGSGRPKPPPKVSASLYAANKRLDRDHDGIACEK